MSLPALEHWFSLSVRRNRKSFVLSCLALAATFSVALVGVGFFAQTERGESFGLLLFAIPGAICSYLLVAQRLRDFGVSGWFSLLWIPVNAFEGEIRIALTLAFFLVLCGIPGSTGANRYGPDPLAV